MSPPGELRCVQSLLCVGISQYFLSHNIYPVIHQCTFLCVCLTHVLEMWLSACLHIDKLHVGVLHELVFLEFHFHCSKSLIPSWYCSVSLSLLPSTFTPPSVIPKAIFCTKVISLGKDKEYVVAQGLSHPSLLQSSLLPSSGSVDLAFKEPNQPIVVDVL